jgi:hypothetical protein
MTDVDELVRSVRAALGPAYAIEIIARDVCIDDHGGLPLCVVQMDHTRVVVNCTVFHAECDADRASDELGAMTDDLEERGYAEIPLKMAVAGQVGAAYARRVTPAGMVAEVLWSVGFDWNLWL